MRLKIMKALCWLLRHPSEREQYPTSARTRCPCGVINVYEQEFTIR